MSTLGDDHDRNERRNRIFYIVMSMLVVLILLAVALL
jgi:predicted nucleic acid-binding Zn ribbon protein